jgi:hypothetical protein
MRNIIRAMVTKSSFIAFLREARWVKETHWSHRSQLACWLEDGQWLRLLGA